MNLAELQTKRAELVPKMRALNDLVEKEKRSFKTEEDSEYRALETELDAITEKIVAEESRAARLSKLVAAEDALNGGGKKPGATPPGAAPAAGDFRSSQEFGEIFESYLQGGVMVARQTAERIAAEKRVDTQQIGLFTKGGALVAPEQFVTELLKAVDDMVFVDKHARHFRLTTAGSLGVPTLDTDIDDFDWTAELLTGNQGEVVFGKRELRPHPMAKSVKVSKTLNRVSAIPISSIVRDRLAYKVGVTREKAFLTGSGTQRPLGVFVASTNGVPTSRDVSTDNTTTAITADGLIEAKHFLKSQYWNAARWVFHRDAIKNIRKLKDGNGQYLWQPGLAGSGMAGTILDQPYDISEFAPNTFTTGLYVGALCAWQYYWIVDALDMTVQFLQELYAATNTDGYLARMETDGAPVLAEAFVRVKLA